MKRTFLGFLVTQLLIGVFAFGCDDEVPSRPPVTDKPLVPSRPGIVQVGGPNDALIDEASACSRFQSALQTGVTRLQCANIPVGECPELVHPLVELPCVMYSEPSVSQCEDIFSAAKTCEDLGPGSCVLTAILDPTDSSGMPLECAERDSTSTGSTASSTSDAADSSVLDPGTDATGLDGAPHSSGATDIEDAASTENPDARTTDDGATNATSQATTSSQESSKDPASGDASVAPPPDAELDAASTLESGT